MDHTTHKDHKQGYDPRAGNTHTMSDGLTWLKMKLFAIELHRDNVRLE